MSDSDDARLAEVERDLAARWPETRIDPTLERIEDLMHLLGDPQKSYPSIHVAGTNGKTTTTRMIDSLLTAFGIRTGRFTSPHLTSITERIAVDGEPMTPEQFVAAYDDIAQYLSLVDGRHDHPLSYFEALTGVALAAFADVPVTAAVIEVGMGGRWDSTNVLAAEVAVITPVGLDHAEYLGDTLDQIAAEKAGIIMAGQHVILARQEPEAADVLFARCVELGAAPLREGVEFGVVDRVPAVGGQLLTLQGINGVYPEIVLPLFGAHQASNAAVALAAVEAFLAGGLEGRPRLDLATVQEGFAAVTSPGRLEVVATNPTVLLDAAHNPHGAAALAAAITDSFSFTHLVGVIGVLADKDAEGILVALEPVLSQIVITPVASRRTTDIDDLAAVAVDVFGDDRVTVADNLAQALALAVDAAESGEEQGGAGVLITGSVALVGQARGLLST